MASPSSSGSSAMNPPGVPLESTPASTPPLPDPVSGDNRHKAVQKVLERSHVASVARGLRSRLSYAAYKAGHNVSHATLPELEKHPLANSSSLARPKRKANYYNNPATQGGPPPPPAVIKKSYYSFNTGIVTGRINGSTDVANGVGTGENLFTAILAPPPAAQARTILNATDPPLHAPSRPPQSPRASKGSVRTIMESTRTASRGRKEATKSPDKNKNTRKDVKGKQKESVRGKRATKGGDVDDLAAAAALSSLLMHRPSLTSDTGSEAGSVRSYQFAQSSTRESAGNGPRKSRRLSPQGPRPSRSRATGELAPSAEVPDRYDASTPRPPPTDNEAADLMLYLATSPSPARKSKNERDEAAFRALGGGLGTSGSRPGRVLFPSASEGTSMVGRLPTASPQRRSGLARNSPGYTSSMSSIGSEIEARPRVISRPDGAAVLMPSASLPLSLSAPSSPGQSKDSGDVLMHDPNSPNASRASHGGGGLRMDVGRKLFEEQQQQHHQHQRQVPPPPRMSEEEDSRSLDPPAGIRH